MTQAESTTAVQHLPSIRDLPRQTCVRMRVAAGQDEIDLEVPERWRSGHDWRLSMTDMTAAEHPVHLEILGSPFELADVLDEAQTVLREAIEKLAANE